MILEPQLDLEHVLKDTQAHKPKLFHGAPRIYNAIVNSPLAAKYDLRSIVACISGSAPLMIETARKFKELTGRQPRGGLRAHRGVAGHPLQSGVRPGEEPHRHDRAVVP